MNYPKLQAYADSCDRQEALFRERISNDSIQIGAYKQVDKFQMLTIDAQSDQITFYQKQSKWKQFWKGTATMLGVVVLGETIYIIGTKNQ